MKTIHRRDFLKTGGVLAGGIILEKASFSLRHNLNPVRDDPSRVVVVTDEDCTSGSAINLEVLRAVMEAGITTYTGILEVGEAWISLFPGITASSVIGIKINTLNHRVSTRPEAVQSVIDGLLRMPVAGGFDSNNIIIWDRNDYDLQRAGYVINAGSSGVRCFGTTHSGVGYTTYGLTVNGVVSRPSRILSNYIDYIINMPVMKDHNVSGATFSLKNHYGSVHNPESLHGGNCDPYIPALNRVLLDEFGPKQRICVVDAVFGIYAGGPTGSANMVYNGVILGEDMVAVDRVGLDILVENGMNHAWQASHIQTASLPPYSLGNYDLSQIERINIVNPTGVSRRDSGSPGDFTLLESCPNPFNQSTSIRFGLTRPAKVRMEIYSVRGRLVKVVADRDFIAGEHALIWDGGNSGGEILPSGTYFCRLSTVLSERSMKMIILR